MQQVELREVVIAWSETCANNARIFPKQQQQHERRGNNLTHT